MSKPSGWKAAGAWLLSAGLVAFVVWNPDGALSPGTLTFLKVLGGIGALFLLLGLVGRLRLWIDPEYASRQAAWKAYSEWHMENTDYLIGLIEKGYTDEQVAVETIARTGCEYEQALDDAKQLRIDHQANLDAQESDSPNT